MFANDYDAFDLFFNNFLGKTGYHAVTSNQKLGYPADVYTANDELHIEIPIVEGKVEDIKITTMDNELRVTYQRTEVPPPPPDKTYFYNGITKRDFDLAWKIPPKYNISELDSTFVNGLLAITIPRSSQSYPKQIEIKTVSGIAASN